MKKALLTMALLVAPFFSHSNIYHNATGGQLAGTTINCDVGQLTIADELARRNANLPRYESTWYSEKHTINKQLPSSFNTNGSCQLKYELRQQGGQINPQTGERFGQYTSYSIANLNGVTKEAPTCIPDAQDSEGNYIYPDHIHQGKDANGIPHCYTSQAMSDVATCDYNDPWLPVGLSNAQFQCKTKEDGSQCRYEMKTANGQSWLQPALEPDDCFIGSGEPYEAPNETAPPTGEECSDIGNGTFACRENPANVCTADGVCQAGCGTVTFDGVTEFLCLSSDTDGDGLGDYADPDIDGDGIRNEDDLDADGDGQEDPNYPIANNTSQQQHQSNIETLLSQIANNTSQSSGGGGGNSPSASAIGESVGDEVKEKLTELGDFSTTDYEQRVDAKIEESNTKIDTFMEAEESDLTNAFDESEFQSSFSTFKNLFTSSGCAAQFSIPFTSNKLDLCEPASRAQPFLYVIFAISTFIYCVRRIQTTARAE